MHAFMSLQTKRFVATSLSRVTERGGGRQAGAGQGMRGRWWRSLVVPAVRWESHVHFSPPLVRLRQQKSLEGMNRLETRLRESAGGRVAVWQLMTQRPQGPRLWLFFPAFFFFFLFTSVTVVLPWASRGALTAELAETHTLSQSGGSQQYLFLVEGPRRQHAIFECACQERKRGNVYMGGLRGRDEVLDVGCLAWSSWSCSKMV
ncbi:hypothetical protein GMOD_00000917 [Pyrenophora seminiperda CCB06]|uniref:Uncharacterized protein n=1 Tax=Pyrenophora seminiperda CCB06 TaxID=1302712 RepID=A0A3M7LXQ2_9PLEO|nr:hypothetical protein GMOD_00000917 [Pyrenophora seminiperda CCB06]